MWSQLFFIQLLLHSSAVCIAFHLASLPVASLLGDVSDPAFPNDFLAVHHLYPTEQQQMSFKFEQALSIHLTHAACLLS